MSIITENLKIIRARINAAAERSGRFAEDIKIVAVTKTRSVEEVSECIRAGIDIIGENRVQEALSKHPQIEEPAQWHLIGHLQKNKVKKALSIFEVIHSVDTLDLAREISRQAVRLKKHIMILLQVNISGEISKFGMPPEQTFEIAKQIHTLPNVKLCGLMTIPPLSETPEDNRLHFRAMAELQEDLTALGIADFKYLSMGMSNDFEVAVEEGANFVRIGGAIFTPNYPWTGSLL